MNNQVVFKLLEEVRLQCRFGKLAYENLRTSLQAMDPEKTFYHVQALLGHACQVSRLLWPARAACQLSASGTWSLMDWGSCCLDFPRSAVAFGPGLTVEMALLEAVRAGSRATAGQAVPKAGEWIA